MMRHGIMIKIGKGPFGKLPKAKQKKKLDEIMGAPKMVAALKQCTTLVTKKLANCIIGAKTSAEFKACKRLE